MMNEHQPPISFQPSTALARIEDVDSIPVTERADAVAAGSVDVQNSVPQQLPHFSMSSNECGGLLAPLDLTQNYSPSEEYTIHFGLDPDSTRERHPQTSNVQVQTNLAFVEPHLDAGMVSPPVPGCVEEFQYTEVEGNNAEASGPLQLSEIHVYMTESADVQRFGETSISPLGIPNFSNLFATDDANSPITLEGDPFGGLEWSCKETEWTNNEVGATIQTIHGNLMGEVNDFFEHCYPSLPVLNPVEIIEGVRGGRQNSDLQFRYLLNAIEMDNCCRMYCLNPFLGYTELLERVNALEQERSNLDCRNLDTVTVSLLLFVAYTALRNTSNAFLHLNTAIDDLETLEQGHHDKPRASSLWCNSQSTTPNTNDSKRIRRLRYVLFNTGLSATADNPSPQTDYRKRRPAFIDVSSDSLLFDNASPSRRLQEFPDTQLEGFLESELDREAVELLLSWTRINAATHIRTLLTECDPNPAPFSAYQGLQNADHLRKCAAGKSSQPDRIGGIARQTGRVSITRSWLICNEILRRIQLLRLTPNNASQSLVRSMLNTLMGVVTSTLAWVQFLDPGNLRMIGLPKIVEITCTFHEVLDLTGTVAMHRGSIVELLNSIGKGDLEQTYTPFLKDRLVRVWDLWLPGPAAQDTIGPNFPERSVDVAKFEKHKYRSRRVHNTRLQ